MDRVTQKPRIDQDGVRVFENSDDRRAASVRLVGIVLAVTLAAIAGVTSTAVLLLRREPPRVAPSRTAEKLQVGSQRASLATSQTGRKLHDFHIAPRQEARDPVPGAETATEDKERSSATAEQGKSGQLENLARDVIDGLMATGTNQGIAAFPPPGTDPIKVGLVVPEDFELPKGYVRHYQVTDDGRRLEAILMFSPDYQFLDSNGQPIPLPDDGIVPPEMAPQGLPLRKLDIPKDPYARSRSGTP